MRQSRGTTDTPRLMTHEVGPRVRRCMRCAMLACSQRSHPKSSNGQPTSARAKRLTETSLDRRARGQEA
eukprot:13826146-Alexandrium_andersonii.AAC.1